MYLLKPSWLIHAGENNRKYEIYSVSVSPDGKRLASGGLDGKIRIWSTEAIYACIQSDDDKSKSLNASMSSTSENGGTHSSSSPTLPGGGLLDSAAFTAPSLPRQLCSMSTHTGAVTVVRFSPSGNYLASGSDDRVILIWERDDARVPRKEFGAQGEADTEAWVARKRLIGHDNDVQDLAWAPDSSILVTVGLDSSIIVWHGSTFEKLKRLDTAHQSHIKGITFDPANKYFATASDDRSIRIIRYNRSSGAAVGSDMTFSFEASITTPFKGSPLSTYFRRCSWSPDGNHIAAANSTNGPVSAVAIINRGTWDSDISLIGHDAPCEVAMFCPRIFSTTKLPTPNTTSADGNDINMITVIATSGQDKTLAIWNTSNPRPLLVAQNVADKAITDICWTPDGTKLFASSLDGTILVASFEEGELGWVAPLEENEIQLTRYGGGPETLQIPENVEQLALEQKIKTQEKNVDNIKDEIMVDAAPAENEASNGKSLIDQAPSTAVPITESPTATVIKVSHPKPVAASALSSTSTAPIASTSVSSSPKKVTQKITITKEGKKRVAPQLISGTNSNGSRLNATQTSVSTIRQSEPSSESHQVMEMSKPSYNLPRGGVSSLIIGSKRKREEEEEGDDGNNVAAESNTKKSKHDELPEFIKPAVVSPASTVAQVRLAVPKVRSFFSRVSENEGLENLILEIRNGSGNEQEPTKVIVSRSGKVLFADFLPRHGHLAAGQSDQFWAIATEEGAIHIYSPTGRKLFPAIVLGSPLSFLESQDSHLLAITSTGMAHVWDISTEKALHPPVSLAPLLDSGSKYLENGLLRAPSITLCAVTSKGCIIITMSNGQGFTYNSNMMSWNRISEQWWATGSQYWNSIGLSTASTSRAYAGSSHGEKGVVGSANSSLISGGMVSLIEGRTNDQVAVAGRGRYVQKLAKNRMLKEGYEGFEGVVSISHLENRISSAKILNSAKEFQHFLLMYAQRIAEEGMKEKLEELFRELLGPLEGPSSTIKPTGESTGALPSNGNMEGIEQPEGSKEGGVSPVTGLLQGLTYSWEPRICGFDKRQLLKDIIMSVGKARKVQRIVMIYAKYLEMV